MKIKLFCKIEELCNNKEINTHIGEFYVFDDTIQDANTFYQDLENKLSIWQYNNYSKFDNII